MGLRVCRCCPLPCGQEGKIKAAVGALLGQRRNAAEEADVQIASPCDLVCDRKPQASEHVSDKL